MAQDKSPSDENCTAEWGDCNCEDCQELAEQKAELEAGWDSVQGHYLPNSIGANIESR